MPYKVVKQGDKFKVFKLDESGKPTGAAIGTHADRGKAQAQVRALYANEKKEVETFTSDSAAINLTITESADIELKEIETKNGGEMMSMAGPCSFEEMDAMEAAEEVAEKMQDMTYKFQMMAGNIMGNPAIEDKAAAVKSLAGEFASRVKKPKADEKSNEEIAKQIAGQNQTASKSKSDTTDAPGGDSDDTHNDKQRDLFIWKEGDTYRWLAAYSNNRRDNDDPPEIISSESHKEFDQALQKGEWPMPELWVWHIPYAVGQTRFHAYDEAAGFPIAGGVFNKGMEWVAEGLIEAGWNGVSHGMPREWIQRSADDSTIITRHRTKEISILPQYAAANKLAFTIINKENEMADETKGLPQHKRDELVATFGEKAQNFLDAVENTSKEADEAGIEKKEQEPALTPDNPVVKALEMFVEQMAILDARLKAIEERPATEEKEQPFDLMAFLKSKSAIGQETTKIDGRSQLAKDAPKEAAPMSATEQSMGMRLGVVDDFLQANQAYYQQERGTN